jgi:hypothetical protein
MDPPRRPWQLIVTGGYGGKMLDTRTWEALDQILDLFPDLGASVVTTADGAFHVARDFPSDYTREVDRILAGVFKANPAGDGRYLSLVRKISATHGNAGRSALVRRR